MNAFCKNKKNTITKEKTFHKVYYLHNSINNKN